MPTIPADRLKALSETIFQGAGVSAVEAEIVARHCIDANLAGHDFTGCCVSSHIVTVSRRAISCPVPKSKSKKNRRQPWW